ncbi:uncharacterized protein LOC6543095 [Drosophila erecta]|uniref:Uncharacterized protein n=1 Tax=Drosophila erecta TaxID=7220 RepID=B3N3A2_DROER|nr:uncharacterized protein LOC6543095 [Drosophila erecta]EDV58742.1 uncharacterized protein Dere_GG10229 [Drosophila erecta]
MKSHIAPLVLLLGFICAALIAAHPHELIEDSTDSNYESLEESGSGYSSAEEFMNAMGELVRRWQEYDAAHENSTDYYDETTLDVMDITTEPAI